MSNKTNNMKKLPKHILDYLNRNTMLTMFGCINFALLKTSTGTRLKDEDLKKRINNAIGHEMVNGEVEFI